ncbi:hypothetical protein C0J52_19267 [Blattella germanica]|nr:hypothetical protein C0J52_19267 [Blattella germanica]
MNDILRHAAKLPDVMDEDSDDYIFNKMAVRLISIMIMIMIMIMMRLSQHEFITMLGRTLWTRR